VLDNPAAKRRKESSGVQGWEKVSFAILENLEYFSLNDVLWCTHFKSS